MLRTVLPALGRAVVMNSFWNCHNKEASESCFREKLEVCFYIFFRKCFPGTSYQVKCAPTFLYLNAYLVQYVRAFLLQ